MINPIFHSKEFSFSEVDVGCMMNGFDDDFLTSANMRDQGGYIVFNTHIWYDNYNVLCYD